ncbi:MAG: DUF2577 domain-containing protein [Paenibacillus dendritiformis]|uniref:DUF2577 domain-containing protein n=1 Tax=uncultured Paenibacillus sp. TaxID=227322 RepID=UPI0028038E32|nr:DUF2577 domain-containing protein [uncultured Paenibacillus sp.]MDU5141056.1 DUF2577 domain-containing protein [Paenibacillus dendritiformis]
MSLVDLIKKISLGALEASNPVAVLFGIVTKANPLEVNVEQRLIIQSDFLIIPESLRDRLKNGDKVILLRVQGGQDFVILDRM